MNINILGDMIIFLYRHIHEFIYTCVCIWLMKRKVTVKLD
jgi:hypothetical protein